jgi:ATP-dependent RNA helicase RhlE
MHVEDYIHRIGRTGRANAIGDAISFVTPEDHGELRALERFIGRGIVRKKAEGFNYTAAAPPYYPGEDDRRFQRAQPQGRPQSRSQHPQRSGQPQHSGHPQRPGQGGGNQRSGPPRRWR